MQENRVQSLKKEVDYSIRMAELIEYNLEDVDAAILAVRAALANGMDWKGLVRMVKEEKKAGNPVAGLIHSLQLEKNCITLLLSNNLDDMDEDEKTRPVDKVRVTYLDIIGCLPVMCTILEQRLNNKGNCEDSLCTGETAMLTPMLTFNERQISNDILLQLHMLCLSILLIGFFSYS